ncbi:MAG: LSU ribosomal protein L9p [Ktedonobacterales bacterium]|jgi:large subunit ribosomal protein L9|nr:MAG: LSU ribosomal protein L9p [Ktedonobacterales bacterium]
MKVILLHEVPGLGQPGDVKDVANGYARNYLLPRQLVTAATASELANLRERVAAAQRRVQRQRESNEALAARIERSVLTFAVRVGQGDRLYGSVTSQNIAEALLELEDINIDRRLIHLREPLRQLGEFEVPVRIAQGVEPKVKVRIVSKETLEETGADVTATEEAVDEEGAEA